MRPTSVLYVHNSANIAGGNRALLGLFDYLDRNRFQAVSVLPSPGPMEDELRARGVRSLVLPFELALNRGRLHGMRLVWSLARVVRGERIALVHANDALTYRHASIPARLLGVRRICHLQFPPEHETLAWALKVRPDAVITCSRHMCEQLEAAQLACLQSVPLVPVENAVDTERCRPPQDIKQLRSSLAIANDGEIVAIVGSVSERKGHQDFLDAAKSVLAQRPRTQFLVVGDDIEGKGAYRALMEEYARSLGIASQVRFVGFRSNAVDWVAASDVIVLPSLKEGLPLSLAEAHGCGKPVVATRVDGIPEIVEHGVTGFLFEPHDIGVMSDAILRLLQDPTLRTRMGAAGRQRAERIFSQRAHAIKVQDVYERVLGRNASDPVNNRAAAN
jgi:glycosyltransferase involved in cell wall biosynthesis